MNVNNLINNKTSPTTKYNILKETNKNQINNKKTLNKLGNFLNLIRFHLILKNS